jgi:hypothetical protein
MQENFCCSLVGDLFFSLLNFKGIVRRKIRQVIIRGINHQFLLYYLGTYTFL